MDAELGRVAWSGHPCRIFASRGTKCVERPCQMSEQSPVRNSEGRLCHASAATLSPNSTRLRLRTTRTGMLAPPFGAGRKRHVRVGIRVVVAAAVGGYFMASGTVTSTKT